MVQWFKGSKFMGSMVQSSKVQKFKGCIMAKKNVKGLKRSEF
ncbi:hypothetical protein D1AOALGA4SA_712 [Olavius algarvensis Delta 1 endosymbiont]|nr:hypothetical protein D1AOALGA4SA_712 [Olavius algarvensis Delta 1 endosymbiont]